MSAYDSLAGAARDIRAVSHNCDMLEHAVRAVLDGSVLAMKTWYEDWSSSEDVEFEPPSKTQLLQRALYLLTQNETGIWKLKP